MTAQEKKTEEHPYDVKTLLEWHAPSRPYKNRTKQFYTTTLMIAVLLSIISAFLTQYMLILVIASIVFVTFAMAAVPPVTYHYKISSEGVMVEDHFYLWQELYDFYFKQQMETPVLHIRTHVFVPGEITIMLGEVTSQQVKKILSAYLPYREYVRPTFMERSGDWLTRNIPLEKPVVHKHA